MSGIESVDTLIIDLPTIRPHVLAMATMHHQSIVLVRIRDTDGVEGVGEGTTIGGFSYCEESPESTKLAIDDYMAATLIGRAMDFSREDRIVLLFCGSKKSLATGGPLAGVLFAQAQVGAIILPLMFFHQIQLMVCAVLARRFAAQVEAAA